MSSEMQRLRNDLDVMQEAIGTTLPFGWRDVGLNLLLAGACVCTAIMAMTVPISMIRWSLVPILLAAIPTLTAMRRRSMDDSRQAARRREYRFGWLVSVVLLAVVIPYLFWERHLGTAAWNTAGGACVLFGGVTAFVLGLTNPGRRYYMGQALPLMVWGLLIPGESAREIDLTGGIAGIFCGIFAAAIQAWQLHRQERA